jgi:hypothetical protein
MGSADVASANDGVTFFEKLTIITQSKIGLVP